MYVFLKVFPERVNQAGKAHLHVGGISLLAGGLGRKKVEKGERIPCFPGAKI